MTATLENKIGITLIATGFEHKNPFDKKVPPKEETKQEEKIVMTLKIPEEQKKIYQQPVLKFDDELQERRNQEEKSQLKDSKRKVSESKELLH